MQLETQKHLFDVLEAVKEIEAYVLGIDYVAFLSQSVTQAAVERKFEIIGEALNRLQREDAEVFGQITGAQRIISFRNILAHGYDVIDRAIVWDIIKNHMPILRAESEKLLAI
ncbi:MAG TPA: HepT-like ribonuclease domain-containing protein [bacterium]|jgi:uncharacterized protein with HEPN domain